MVLPTLQGKNSFVTKRILLPYIRPLIELIYNSGPDGICTFPPYQVNGLIGPRARQACRNAGSTFFAII